VLKEEQDLRRERGFDDQDVLELHTKIEELKFFYMSLCHLREELEFLKSRENAC
jgi:hypothetical protein